ncbi:ribonuclease HI [Methylobacterium soli]|uniref:Ribonuclease H n=1 Tax=Methylobacterium soli TaxID=553447 RepID=A0A6L3T183_9HYPH|nr:ribonuclease HI [Methylobacterium soli]KAB1080330.1 ribonuclease HI [Methylobacterium soli]GJE41399.1 Ribonuclease H [Methylobacterium soli]
MRTVVYADGGCDPNPGPGGWGVVIAGPDGPIDLCGGEPGTTNNRMELTAAIRALESFPEGAQIEMRCDSQYVVKSVTEWMRGWKAKGWRTTTGEVKNVDLMKRLDALAAARDVRWTWVRGHAGDPMNERADRLATRGRREARGLPAPAPQAAPQPLPALSALPQAAAASAPGLAAPAPNLAPAPSLAPAPGPRTAPVPIDAALGLEVSRAAKRAGQTTSAFVEEALRLVLALGPEATARLRAELPGQPAAPKASPRSKPASAA